jgi:hypothetical protein
VNKIQREFLKTGRSSFDSNGIKIAIFRRELKMKLGEGWQETERIEFLKFDIIIIE